MMAEPVLYIKKFAIPEGSTGREKHQLEHRAGLELLALGLEQCFGLKIPDLAARIGAGEKGKPYLPAYPQIHFNISHSGNVAVCALGSQPLGVDVEKLRPMSIRPTKRMLSIRERAFLESCPAGQQEEVLFRFWTLKESYAKALGVGLGMDFTRAEFPLPLPELAQVEEGVWDAERARIRGPEPVGEAMGAAGERWKFAQMGWEGYIFSFCGMEELAGLYIC